MRLAFVAILVLLALGASVKDTGKSAEEPGRVFVLSECYTLKCSGQILKNEIDRDHIKDDGEVNGFVGVENPEKLGAESMLMITMEYEGHETISEEFNAQKGIEFESDDLDTSLDGLDVEAEPGKVLVDYRVRYKRVIRNYQKFTLALLNGKGRVVFKIQQVVNGFHTEPNRIVDGNMCTFNKCEAERLFFMVQPRWARRGELFETSIVLTGDIDVGHETRWLIEVVRGYKRLCSYSLRISEEHKKTCEGLELYFSALNMPQDNWGGVLIFSGKYLEEPETESYIRAQLIGDEGDTLTDFFLIVEENFLREE